MTLNQQMISEYVEEYKNLYLDQFNREPEVKNWFGFLGWLGNTTIAGNFKAEDINFAKELLR